MIQGSLVRLTDIRIQLNCADITSCCGNPLQKLFRGALREVRHPIAAATSPHSSTCKLGLPSRCTRRGITWEAHNTSGLKMKEIRHSSGLFYLLGAVDPGSVECEKGKRERL